MAKEKSLKRITVPVLPLRGMVLFPRMVLHFDVGREASTLGLEFAMEEKRQIFIASQYDVLENEPKADDIFQIGVVAEVKQIIKAQGHLRVMVEGLYRATLIEYQQQTPFYLAEVEEYPIKSMRGVNKSMIGALVRSLKELFEEYSQHAPRINKELVVSAMAEENPELLSEYIASSLPLSYQHKQEILEESSIPARLKLLLQLLEEENDILTWEQDIHEKVRGQIDANQREYYLREQVKAIQSELGEGEAVQDEIAQYKDKILKLELSEESETKLLKETARLSQMPYNSQEASVIKTWLDTVLDLPWNTLTTDRNDVKAAKKQLDHDHYGMDKVKDRILELIAVRQLAPTQKGQIICLVGPPGVGKTSIAQSMATAMQKKYTRISLGGVRDESEIRGHRKTYIGAMPGRIMVGMQQAKSRNPIMLLDEVDKMGNDFRGDPSAALLEVLDSEQNNTFRDHYIELPFDLSDVLFIATANTLDTIPRPLLDRMEIIELYSYTREEKFQIANRHFLKKQMEKHGLNSKQFRITKDGFYALIDHYTKEAGVRTLERLIATLCRKSAKVIVSGELERVVINGKNISEYLGPARFKQNFMEKSNEVGLVNGLAWTSVGGEMLQVEVAVLEGNGRLQLTGSLGEVMKESAQAAISYVRTICDIYSIDPHFYRNKDIHIHIPEGAVPKDGPSAGVTITTALVSALSGIPAKASVAMTGEISLRGRVLPIGGLREKTMAAYRNGITTVIIPEDNMADLYDVEAVVKESIQFVPAKHISTVLQTALVENMKPQHTKNYAPPIIRPIGYEGPTGSYASGVHQ